jgi:hypothetical protein
VRVIITIVYAVYAAFFLMLLTWIVSVYVIKPIKVQEDLFNRRVFTPFGLTYVQDSIGIDGTYYEWEYKLETPKGVGPTGKGWRASTILALGRIRWIRWQVLFPEKRQQWIFFISLLQDLFQYADHIDPITRCRGGFFITRWFYHSFNLCPGAEVKKVTSWLRFTFFMGNLGVLGWALTLLLFVLPDGSGRTMLVIWTTAAFSALAGLTGWLWFSSGYVAERRVDATYGGERE